MCYYIFVCVTEDANNGTSVREKERAVKSYKAIRDPKPSVLILRCSDPRFRIAFRDFTAEELGLAQGEFVPINVAGGPAALAHQKAKPEDFHYLMSQIKFFLEHFDTIRKVVLVGHQNCGYYKTIDHPDKEDKEKKDLPRATDILLHHMPGIKVESYYARFSDESRAEIVFEKC